MICAMRINGRLWLAKRILVKKLRGLSDLKPQELPTMTIAPLKTNLPDKSLVDDTF
jgi:succinate dehydrogenase/fumarate reductase-like Fe-S protein